MVVYQGEDATQLIKDTADIAEVIGEHVSLKRAGATLKGLCPFHSEKTPSFTVNPERRIYHCFGCGEGGDVIRFVMNYHRLSFPEAIKELARRYHINLPEKPLNQQAQEKARKREALFVANEKAALLFQDLLFSSPEAEKARTYLEKRGIPEESAREFGLGFAPDSWNFLVNSLPRKGVSQDLAQEAGLIVARDNGGFYDRFRNRLMFPITGLTGRVLGFGGRILDDGQPKYMNSPESMVFDKGRTLFGLYNNRDQIRQAGNCLLVEGNFDLLSLAVHGVRNVAAPLGTALTQAQIRALKGYTGEVILLFDGDPAGLKAAMRSVPLFLSEQVSARIAVLPADHDPDTFIRQVGREGLAKHLEKALPMAEFVFGRLVADHGLSLDGKARIVAELRELARTVSEPLARDLFVSHFAAKLELSPQQLLAGVISARAPRIAAEAPPATGQARLPTKQKQLLEFLVLFPEHLPAFLEAGLEEVVNNEFGLSILDLLKNCHEQGMSGGPEQLLDQATGQERGFISRILIAAPLTTEENRMERAEEMLRWLALAGLKVKKERLLKQINEAQQANDDRRLFELMEKKVRMDRLAHQK